MEEEDGTAPGLPIEVGSLTPLVGQIDDRAPGVVVHPDSIKTETVPRTTFVNRRITGNLSLENRDR